MTMSSKVKIASPSSWDCPHNLLCSLRIWIPFYKTLTNFPWIKSCDKRWLHSLEANIQTDIDRKRRNQTADRLTQTTPCLLVSPFVILCFNLFLLFVLFSFVLFYFVFFLFCLNLYVLLVADFSIVVFFFFKSALFNKLLSGAGSVLIYCVPKSSPLPNQNEVDQKLESCINHSWWKIFGLVLTSQWEDMSIRPSIRPSAPLSLCLSICFCNAGPFIYLSFFLSINLSDCQYVCLSTMHLLFPSVPPFIRQSTQKNTYT